MPLAVPEVGEASEVVAKDTESYYSLLYQGKTNRWLLRYHADKKSPTVTFTVPMTDERKREVARAGLVFASGEAISLPSPEHLARIPGLLFDALDYCRDDANFKRQGKESV